MKIAYKNVCSMRDAQVTFEPGKLICILGETNQGKSALFYSLVDGLMNRPIFKKWINNTALKENPKAVAWIGLTDDEGNLWQVEAGTGHFYFRVNDVKYEKVGRKNIFELINGQIPQLLYDPENTSPIMNILDEDSGMFPVDRSDAQIFKTYERLLSLSCTEDILRTIKLDTDDVDFKISEATSSIQKQNTQITSIESFFEKINVQQMLNCRATLCAYRDVVNHLSQIYLAIYKSACYTNRVLQNADFPVYSFDVMKFESSLKTLIKATNDSKYIMLSQKVFEKQKDFDVQNCQRLNDTTIKAKMISDELSQLDYYVSSDETKLKEVTDILDSIKVCPLCGKPMEG